MNPSGQPTAAIDRGRPFGLGPKCGGYRTQAT